VNFSGLAAFQEPLMIFIDLICEILGLPRVGG